MATANIGDTVRIHYRIRMDNGRVVEDSSNRGPLRFTLGEGSMAAGLEQAIAGMRPGDARTVRMPVEGEDSPLRRHFVCRVERSRLRPGVEPRLGQRIRLDRQEGMSLMATVTEVTDTHVTLDANALPAGRNLLFDITLISAAPPRRGRPAAALWRHPGTGTYHSLQ